MRKISVCSLDNEAELKIDNFHDFVTVYQEYIEDVLLCDVRDIYQIVSYTKKTNDKLRSVFEYVRLHAFELRSFFDYAFRCAWKRGELYPDIYFLHGMLRWRNVNKEISSNFSHKLKHQKERLKAMKLMDKMDEWNGDKVLRYFLRGKNSPYLASYLRFFQKYGYYDAGDFRDWNTGKYFESVFIAGQTLKNYTRLRNGIVESGWKEFLREREV